MTERSGVREPLFLEVVRLLHELEAWGLGVLLLAPPDQPPLSVKQSQLHLAPQTRRWRENHRVPLDLLPRGEALVVAYGVETSRAAHGGRAEAGMVASSLGRA